MQPFKLSVLAAALSISLWGMSSAVFAQPCSKTPSVHLNASASEQVDNTDVRLNWQVQFERDSGSDAMQEVSHVLQGALMTLKSQKGIRNVRTNVQSYPRYDRDQKITHWVAIGSLNYEMPLKMLEQNGNSGLQPPLALNGVQYFVGESKLDEVKSQLLEQAMMAFQGKAAVVQKGFHAKGYQLGEISINDSGRGGMPQPVMMRMQASEASMGKLNVPASGGSSEVTVGVSGTICLKP